MKAVLFDFYGTLARAVSWGPDAATVLARRGHRLADAADAAWHAEVYDGMEHHEHSADRDRYMAWERDRLRRLATASGVPASEVEDLAADLHAATRQFELAAYEEVPAVLAELRRRGVVVAVCSNWTWDLDVALDQAGLGDVTDVAVSSAHVGVRKPHPRIFEVTLERCGVDARDALFVGDTWVPDVKGALAAGMAVVHVWRPADVDGQVPPPVVEGVRRLPDLTRILD